MRATYRRKVDKPSIGAEAEIIGREDALRGRVAVELPVSLAETVQGAASRSNSWRARRACWSCGR
ncbi:MAG TPA: hypothetical protein PK458_21095 [Phycisphaerae bacterium]|nr:hypothetical protein [Phycisphaerae bacterium]HON68510.1 hypothetical protein [Phycisphaerae bacterium]HPP27682.1 hypothetical protein [Phycisphaerae bacterium]HPU28682.1 hypothetical protein [Phycisphaerae bacterium]